MARTPPLAHQLSGFLICLGTLLTACADGPGPSSGCVATRDCSGSTICVNGRCVLPSEDAAPEDVGGDSFASVDSEVPDIDTIDAGTIDAGTMDAGTMDAGTMDAGTMDAGPRCLGPCIRVLRDNAAEWTEVFPTGALHHPSLQVRAAFDIESLGLLYVLTQTSYHVLRLSDLSYIRSGTLATLFHGRLGGAILSAESVPGNHNVPRNVSAVSIATSIGVYAFNYDTTTGMFDYDLFVPRDVVENERWVGDFAPEYGDARARWLSVEDNEAWIRATCPGSAAPIGVYGAVLASDRIHIIDLSGVCFQFVASMPLAMFAPFARGSAPSAIDALTYQNGDLWAFLPVE